MRWRLQLWQGFLLVVLLTGFGVVVYQLQRMGQEKALDEELQKRVSAVSSELRRGPMPFNRRGPPGFGEWEDREHRDFRPPPPDGGPRREFEPPRRPPFDGLPGGPGRPGGRGGPFGAGPGELRLSPATANLFDSEKNSFYFAIWSRDGTFLTNSAAAPRSIPVPDRTGNDTRPRTRMRGELRESYHFTELGDCVLVGKSMATDLRSRHRFALVLLGAGGSVLAFGLGTGGWFTSRAIRPIEEISSAAQRISAGNLSERVVVADSRNELGRLAEVLNRTFARLESAFTRQKQFTADAAHELRTPLAVIISETQTALTRERTSAEYRETIQECLDTAQRMRRLTETLLALARADSSEEQLERKEVDLPEETRRCVEELRPLAVKASVQIYEELSPATAFVNVERLRQVITNLLTNAIYYNRTGGSIRIQTNHSGEQSTIVVSDTGQGISAEDLPHIFERFYRGDKVRSRSEGRTGLGLAICKAIVDTEGGTIEVESEWEVGSTFRVKLPRKQQAKAKPREN